MPTLRSAAKTIIPSSIHPAVLSLYNTLYDRSLVLKANTEYYRRDRPEVNAEKDAPDHVILIVVDAMRGDVISSETTPFLAEMSGTTCAVSPAPWTFPAVTSIFTGQYPHEHGAMRQTDEPDLAASGRLPPKLPNNNTVLTDYFASSGYETYAGFGFPMPLYAVGGTFKKHRLYRDSTLASESDCKDILSDYLSWVESRNKSKTFAYLHLSDLHSPLDPPTEYWDKYNIEQSIENIEHWDHVSGGSSEDAERYKTHKKRLYKAAANYVDTELEQALAQVKEMVEKNFAVIITSDHGELFWDHDKLDAKYFYDHRGYSSLGHGGTPYEGVTRVPILGKNIEFPDQRLSLVDLKELILKEVGINNPNETTGLRNPKEDINRILLTEASRYGYEKKSVVSNKWKLIVSRGDGHQLGFKLPEEEIGKLPEDIEDQVKKELPEWPRKDKSGEMNEVGKMTKRRLKNLGYMQE